MVWYLNRALTNFRSAVNARWPNRDKSSDGTIGDAAHQASTSDHNEDPDGSVDAWDMDVDGVDVQACIRAALAHESIQYVIYNRRITSRSMPGGLGVWHPYTGPNPHDKHVHYNTRSAFEASTKPWIIGEDDDMPTAAEVVDELLKREIKAQDGTTAPVGVFIANTFMRTVGAQYGVIDANKALATIAGQVGIDAVELAAIQEASRKGAVQALAGLDAEDIAAQLVAILPADLALKVSELVSANLAKRLAS